jgi:PelA/Pel-15E family pectate lyase
MASPYSCLTATLATLALVQPAFTAENVSRDEALSAMRKATTFYREQVALHGGYVYYYSPDLKERRGEGVATATQIWVQAPGTPAVGMAFLKAYTATKDPYYLEAALEAAGALIYGQLESGGWTHSIDFDPQSPHAGRYRNGKGHGRNHSSLDDGVTQNALGFLMHLDRALEFKNEEVHTSVEVAKAALLKAQFPSGAFPQGWAGPVTAHPVLKASYPEYDWRTENRIKNYWDLPTLNDGVCGHVASVLIDAWQIYRDEACREALTKLGDFLILAQMPEPQPAWTQQYDHDMHPVWARKFEPPAIVSRESQDAMQTLLRIYEATGDKKYLEPIPRALAYLKRSVLPDGQLSRYYELQSNKPLYFTHAYQLTYDDSDVPEHYGWKIDSRIGKIESALARVKPAISPSKSKTRTAEQIRAIIDSLDAEGRWLSTYTGQGLVGQPKLKKGYRFIASEVFNENLEALSDFIAQRE